MSSLTQGPLFTSVTAGTSGSRNFGSGVTSGRLLTCVVGFPATNAITGFGVTDDDGNAWQRAVRMEGTVPDVTIEIWWAIAANTVGALLVTAAWAESANAVIGCSEHDVTGSGAVAVYDSGAWEETSNSTAHNSADTDGVNAGDGDVMISAGMPDGSQGSFAAGESWSTLGTSGRLFIQSRLPTGAVAGDRAPWTSGNSRTAVSAVAVFRRSAGEGTTGTGAVTAPAATVSGTGTPTVTGTGAIVAPAAEVESNASGVTGTGAVTAPAADVSGEGYTIPDDAIWTVQPAGLDPVGVSGDGAIIAAPAEVAGAGAPTFTGTGALDGPAADVDGSGTSTVTGSGAVTAGSAAVSGAGTPTVVGTGTVTAPAAQVDGTDSQDVTGTGAVVAPGAEVSGSGSPTVVGTGAVDAPSADVAGSGTPTVTGIGDVSAPAAEASGAGTPTVIGTAPIVAPGAIVAGQGTSTVTGSGAIEAPAAEVDGAEGLAVNIAAVLASVRAARVAGRVVAIVASGTGAHVSGGS